MNPGLLAVCLYHTVECQQQREVGEYLAAKGAKVDLVFAAALGRTDLVGFVARPEGGVRAVRRDAAEVADGAIKHRRCGRMNGRDATVAQLLDLGADVNGRAHVSGAGHHAAAWGGLGGVGQHRAPVAGAGGGHHPAATPNTTARRWGGRRIAGSQRGRCCSGPPAPGGCR